MVTQPVPKTAIPHNDNGEKKDDSPDTSTWLTRDEGARLLGLSVQTIKNYEKRGLLVPQKVSRLDGQGREQLVVVHDPRALANVRSALQTDTKRKFTADTSAWLTRNEATDVLSVSTQTLKNYESRGLLHPLHVPRRDARGHEQVVVVYDPKELAKLPRGLGRPFAPRELGEINARAYELFNQGRSVQEVVIELREPSDKIRELREKWEIDGGEKLVVSPEAKRALETLLGPFEDVTALVELVTEKLKPRQKKSA